MDDDELLRVVDSLVKSTEGQPWSRAYFLNASAWITLNRDGCLILAARLLELAAKPVLLEHAKTLQTLNGIEQIVASEEDFSLGMLEKAELVTQTADDLPAASPRFRDRLALVGCGLVGFGILMMLLSGVYFWIDLIFLSN